MIYKKVFEDDLDIQWFDVSPTCFCIRLNARLFKEKRKG